MLASCRPVAARPHQRTSGSWSKGTAAAWMRSPKANARCRRQRDQPSRGSDLGSRIPAAGSCRRALLRRQRGLPARNADVSQRERGHMTWRGGVGRRRPRAILPTSAQHSSVHWWWRWWWWGSARNTAPLGSAVTARALQWPPATLAASRGVVSSCLIVDSLCTTGCATMRAPRRQSVEENVVDVATSRATVPVQPEDLDRGLCGEAFYSGHHHEGGERAGTSSVPKSSTIRLTSEISPWQRHHRQSWRRLPHSTSATRS